MKELFIYLFAFLSFLTTAQTNEEELEKKSFDELYDLFFDYEFKLSIQKNIADFYILKGIKENKKIQIARGYYLLSLLDRETYKTKSITYLDSVIKYSYTSDDFYFPYEAYIEKAKLYSNLYEYEKTISSYLLAEKYTKENNDLDNYYRTKYLIGIFKSEIIGEYSEALKLYKECENYYKDKDINHPYYSKSYLRLLFVLADVHKSLNDFDSATHYNKIGYNQSIAVKNEHLQSLFILNEGANLVFKKSFKIALDSIKKSYTKILNFKDQGNILAAYYYYGKCYEGLNNKELAIKYYKKVDSIYHVKKYITPEFVSGYHYLISHYKNKGDKIKQLEYLTTFMKIDSTLQKGYKRWNKLLKDKYDFPHLVEDKENLIAELHQDKKSNHGIMIVLGGIIIISLFFVIRQTQQKKAYKKRFDALMQTREENNNIESEIDNISEIKDNDLGIVEETANSILKQLSAFEKKRQFLKPNITLNNIAQDFGTNTKYLSTIINTKKEKKFVHYINDLRIDYIVSELKTNTEIRKYTLKAIAEEAGFNSAEVFSTAFFKRTGIKPSYFLKNLLESNNL